jgi:aspartate dehydrogenase
VRIGIAGFGNVGQTVAWALVDGGIEGAELVAVSARDIGKASEAAAALSPAIKVVPISELAALCDLVVECATGAAFPEIARAVLPAGKDLICVSAAGFLDIPDLADLARRHGAQVQIASGTMPGLDILRSAAEGAVSKVHLKLRNPPSSLASEPYELNQGFDFRTTPPPEAVKVFEGTAADAARAFPRHMNVAVSVSLAGIGFDNTKIEFWIDPTVTGSISLLEIEGDNVSLTMSSRNIPSDNPKTSRIVAPSILAALRARLAPIRVGS